MLTILGQRFLMMKLFDRIHELLLMKRNYYLGEYFV